jgi:hypothetical protein
MEVWEAEVHRIVLSVSELNKRKKASGTWKPRTSIAEPQAYLNAVDIRRGSCPYVESNSDSAVGHSLADTAYLLATK